MSGSPSTTYTRSYRLGPIECAQCSEKGDLYAVGWRSYRLEETHSDELPTLAFCCPDCAERDWAS
jgi:hypothetical protein